MSVKKSRRDVGIELARVIACLIVVGVHVSLADFATGSYDLSRGFINCLLAAGVAIFWMITGCFLFRPQPYATVLRRAARTIALPIALFSLVCLHFSGWLFDGTSLAESLSHTPTAYWDGLKSALMLKLTIPGTGHLWYCYTYLLVLLAFPVLQAFAQWMDADVRREKWFMGISFALLLLNDWSKNELFGFSHHSINAAVPAAVEMLWGHILYKHKDAWLSSQHRTKKILLPAAAFVLLNLVRMYIVYASGSKAVLYWYSTIGLLCAVCVLLFCLPARNGRCAEAAAGRLISWLGGHTFMIYLVHFPIRNVLYRYAVHTNLFDWLSGFSHGVVLEVLYTVGMLVLLFALSLIVSVLIRGVSRLFVRNKQKTA